ncbi:CBS-domain-containing protein [Mycena indigotica]|uniref:CBS-domain-containing protein n=1 Tax=Mycena indigotica TaxID=2126181 RepID=A0A8H6W6T8_9AGAR|nr:CBS-domain-containing protein [Mycena indigotica]KAF7306977.1 CBS-domain-containing protein [Mycena indigotica]
MHFDHNLLRKPPHRPPDHHHHALVDMTSTDKGKSKRPDPPHRSSSFNKRHASFDSPREVPLPSPMRGPPNGPVFDDDNDWELVNPTSAKLQKAKQPKQNIQNSTPSATSIAPTSPPSAFASKPSKLKSHPQPPQQSTILPYSRPYSLPEAHSYQGRQANAATLPPPTVDRTSSASLPLPMQVPFSALPKVITKPSVPSPVYERPAAEASLRPPLHSAASSTSSGSSGSLPSAPPSRSHSHSPTPDSTSPSSVSYPATKRGPAPMPPAEQTTSHGGVASYRPPRTTYTPVPTAPPDDMTTAITRTPSIRGSAASFPPPEPPVILPGAEEVESTTAEYKLIVRLPGFKRDGITLATKKRRILHLVADSWEAGGGHFERRISFGYDADLSQVRAEFDGELLRVVIPRRVPPDMAGATVPST